MYKDLGHPAKQTLSISVTKKVSQSRLYMTKVTVCSEFHTKHVITLCVQNVGYCCYAFERLMLLEQIILNLQVFEVLTSVSLTISTIWDVVPCPWLCVSLVQGQWMKSTHDFTFLQNSSDHLPSDTWLCPRR